MHGSGIVSDMTVRFLSVLLGALILAIVAVVLARPSGPLFGPSGTLTIVTYTVPSAGGPEERIFGLGLGDVRMMTPDGGSERLGSARPHRITLGDTSGKTVVASHSVRTGAYTGIRLTLKNPELRMAEDAVRIRRLSLWNEQVSLDIPYTVIEGETTVILIGFELGNALRDTGDELVYVPTVHIETRQGVRVLEVGDGIEIEGGTIGTSAMFGMNEQGVMRMNYRMPPQGVQEQVPAVIEPDAGEEDVDMNTDDTSDEAAEEEEEEPSDDATQL